MTGPSAARRCGCSAPRRTSAGCTHVALESTGVCWRPVYNLLEGRVALVLVNAQHVKMVPGRKTGPSQKLSGHSALCVHGFPALEPPKQTRPPQSGGSAQAVWHRLSNLLRAVS